MLSTRIAITSEVVRSSRVMQVEAMFDVPPSQRSELEWEVDLPIDEEAWNIGLIVGPSGSGKTTIARELFGDQLVREFPWDETKSILDCFPAKRGIQRIVGLLSAVGFGSPPAWLRPFHALSNGEQFRVMIARAMAESDGLVVIDEFTSVVDRQVAKVASHAIQKAIRRQKRRLIALSCHYDVIEWLQPDWIYQPHTREFARRSVQRHPPVELEVYPVDHSCWEVFKHHHYLNSRLSTTARCVGGFIDDQCVAFASWRHFPHPQAKNIMQGHRLVVLPDYQGLGIGGRMDDWIGQYLYGRGYRYHNVVAHPAMIAYYSKSPRWKLLRYGRQRQTKACRILRGNKGDCQRSHQFRFSMRRNSATFVYVPPAA